MSSTVDPHERPCMPAFGWNVQYFPSVEMSGGPDRVVTDDPSPGFKARAVGFTPSPPAIAQRYVLGFAFTWDDLLAVARERARSCGRRQKVTRDEDTWLIVTTPEPVYRSGEST